MRYLRNSIFNSDVINDVTEIYTQVT